MTLEELKQRILETGYLPEWLKDNVDLMGSTVPNIVMPVTAPPQPETKKWCPFSQVRMAHATGGAAFNRILRVDTQAGVTEMTTTGSFCIESACAMWNGSECGLKSTPSALMQLVGEVTETYTSYNDAQDTVEGDATGV